MAFMLFPECSQSRVCGVSQWSQAWTPCATGRHLYSSADHALLVLEQEMTAEERKLITHLDKCDFSEIHRHFLERAEARRTLPKEQKQVGSRFWETWRSLVGASCREPLTEPSSLSGLRRWTRSQQVLSDFQ